MRTSVRPGLALLAVLTLAPACGNDEVASVDGGVAIADGALAPSADGAAHALDAMTATPDAAGRHTDATPAADAEPPPDAPPPPPRCGPLDNELRLHQIQVKGSHNSYHIEPDVVFHDSHRYTHAPLDVQLGLYNVRAFELDVHRDNALTNELSVYHINIVIPVDAETTCDKFTDCLAVVKSWSDANRCHLPIMIWIEVKDSTGGFPISDYAIIDDEIRSVFPEDQLFTPDDLRGDHSSLREVLDGDGWPTLGELRGQVLFIALSGGDRRDDYLAGAPALAGRAMFVRADTDELTRPWAAIIKVGSGDRAAIAAAHAVRALVAANICNADESDEDCHAQRTVGIENGLHMLKDDYPGPVDDRDYWLDLGDFGVQCNPATAPPVCTDEALEAL